MHSASIQRYRNPRRSTVVQASANVFGRPATLTPCLRALSVPLWSRIDFDLPQQCDSVTYSLRGSTNIPSTSLTPGAPLGPRTVTSRRCVGFHEVLVSLTEHFMWLKVQSWIHCLARSKLSLEAVFTDLGSMVLTPGSTASEKTREIVLAIVLPIA